MVTHGSGAVRSFTVRRHSSDQVKRWQGALLQRRQEGMTEGEVQSKTVSHRLSRTYPMGGLPIAFDHPLVGAICVTACPRVVGRGVQSGYRRRVMRRVWKFPVGGNFIQERKARDDDSASIHVMRIASLAVVPSPDPIYRTKLHCYNEGHWWSADEV